MEAVIDAVVHGESRRAVPRVVVVGLASCFGCQLQITNAERYLMDVVGQLDITYWQLASDAPMPESFDVAIIEGAVTTNEALQTVRLLRERAATVILIGACATTGGIPGMAAKGFEDRSAQVYAQLPDACGDIIAPRPVSDVIKVDYEVRCCPIDTLDFVDVLEQALFGSNRYPKTSTMCGECKRNDTRCFYTKGVMCLGLVTRAGCRARCVNLGRPCNGCRGLSPDANLEEARRIVAGAGLSVNAFDEALEMYNQVNPAFAPAVSAAVSGKEA